MQAVHYVNSSIYYNNSVPYLFFLRKQKTYLKFQKANKTD